jgi:hypothetical protein
MMIRRRRRRRTMKTTGRMPRTAMMVWVMMLTPRPSAGVGSPSPSPEAKAQELVGYLLKHRGGPGFGAGRLGGQELGAMTGLVDQVADLLEQEVRRGGNLREQGVMIRTF